MRQRAMIGVVFVLGISIGAYFGSVQLAASTPNTAPRVVTLRVGDVAVFGRCSKRPLSLARYRADVLPDAVSVWDVGAKEQLYVTPR